MGVSRKANGGPGDLGIAFDIGSTTIAAYLVGLPGKRKEAPRILASGARLNSQRAFGIDEFSRIEYSLRTDRGTDELSRLVRSDVRTLADELLARVGAGGEDLVALSAVGSSAMLRVFAGRHPSYGAGGGLACERVGAPEFDLPYPRCGLRVGAIAREGVGADLLAAIRAAGLEDAARPVLLIDLGAGGGAALGDAGGIHAWANAGGPPFEGPSLSCGTGGVPGAVSSLQWESGRLRWTAIEGEGPIGLCASGVVDAAACLVRASLVESTGALAEKWWSEGYPLVRTEAKTLRITQSDLRHIQLAKAAVATGISALLAKRGIGYGGVDRVLFSGSFGGQVSPAAAAVIGIVPKSLLDRAESIDNASGAGAVRLAAYDDECERINALADRCVVVDPSASPGFDERFAAELLFPSPDAVLPSVVPAGEEP